MGTSKPNVVMIVLDSLRPEWLSCYQSKVQTSPRIDRLAGSAYVFENAISPSAWTFPCMASVFTGMLPTKHGGHDQHQLLDSPYATMAELFSNHGYDTAAFSDVPYVGPMTRLDRGFRTMSNLQFDQVSVRGKWLKAVGRLHRAVTGKYQKTNETPVVFTEAMRWLDRGRKSQSPFLLYIHSDETHAPFLPPARLRRKYSTASAARMHGINQDKHLYIGGAVTMTDQDFEHLHQLARAETAYIDEWLGRLFDRLEKHKAFEDTVVVIMADHGDNLGEHGLLRHGLCLYDTLVHVPLIIKLPGDRSGQRVRSVVQLIDLLPTLARAAGLPATDAGAQWQGQDLVEAVSTGDFAGYAISELYPHSREARDVWKRKVPDFMAEYDSRFNRLLRSYRTDTHKLIWSSNGRHELYDLKQDPSESHNIFLERKDLAAQLAGRLDAWMDSFPHAISGKAVDEAPRDELVTQRLRELGYLD
jgi:arylsulfatase A-like enzyme